MAVPSNPGWKFGYVPSPGEWANVFSGKVDYPAPIAQGGTGGQTAPAGNYNLQQRALLAVSDVAAIKPLTNYGLRTSTGHLEILLPSIATVADGDWILLTDVDYDAAANNVTISGSGANQIALHGVPASTQSITVDGGQALLIVKNGVWAMYSPSEPAPAAGGALTGAETWTVFVAGVPETITAADIAAYASGTTQFTQWVVWFNGTPLANEILALYTPAKAFTLPADFVGSVASAPNVNPTATCVLHVNLLSGGISTVIGQISISTSGVVTMTTTAGIAYAINVGDRLSVTGPAMPDATIAGFSMAFIGPQT
jgi:hypothetical protein